jgi:Flp pilus assembly protein TadG
LGRAFWRSAIDFLHAMRRDVRGNTLVIVAAALVPLAGIVGSGVDMSRAYMAKTRLQSACDAASLAGRRIMQNDTLNQNVTDEAVRFFNYNFPQHLFDTATFTPSVTKPTSGTIRVTAATSIPTTVMRIFGFTTLPLSVSCDASLNFVNTDVMLVLDTTGSMNDDVRGHRTSSDANRKITALRDAVMALYDTLKPTQDQLEGNGMRLRYGIVPYSSTVHVGELIRAVNPDYLADTVSYQSRDVLFSTPAMTPSPVADTPVQEVYSGSISQDDCDKYGKNQNFTGFTASGTSGGGPAPAATWTRSYRNNENAGTDWGWSGAADTSGTKRTCRRWATTTNTTYATRYAYTTDTVGTTTYDTSQFKLGEPVTIGLDRNSSNDQTDDFDGTMPASNSYNLIQIAGGGQGMGTRSTTWNGCIEEPDTVDTIVAGGGYAIPSGAYDLDINLIPTGDQMRWRPMWPDIVWTRNGSSDNGREVSGAACPAEAKRLQAWTRDSLETYVNGLNPEGSTYHDIGMIWGARLLSSGGIFADSPSTFNGMPVSRNIIFMTDGQMDTDNDIYHAYGVERYDQRITGMSNANESERNGRHTQRFKMICNAAKAMGYSIWVIAFGTTLTSDMIECASNPNQASTIADRDALIARFQQIGSQIGALRLTQ